MSSTSNFYRISTQSVSANTGNNAQSIKTGENNMENSNTEYTTEELAAIEELNNMKVHQGQDKASAKISDEIPAGSYIASITKANATVHDVGKYDIVSMEIRVQAEPYSGFVLNKLYHQKSKKSVDFFKREMKEIGFHIHGRDELPDLCESLVGKIIVADIVDQQNGNQGLFLKCANRKKTVAAIDPDDLW